jgi:hypothetical protein
MFFRVINQTKSVPSALTASGIAHRPVEIAGRTYHSIQENDCLFLPRRSGDGSLRNLLSDTGGK